MTISWMAMNPAAAIFIRNDSSVALEPMSSFYRHRRLNFWTQRDRKYRLLFSSSSHRRKPGPKGPSAELIAAIVELKSRNPKFGYVRISQQITHAFGVDIDKDIIRRVLAKHYRPGDSGFSLTPPG